MSRKYYVKYQVASIAPPKEQTAGPYDSYAQAVVERDDIQGYEGIYNVRIESKEED